MSTGKWKWHYAIAAVLGLLYGVITHFGTMWTTWNWCADAEAATRVWQVVGIRPPYQSSHISGVLRIMEKDIVIMELPNAIARDLLQQVVGSAGHLLGLGVDRYDACYRILESIAPTGALWLLFLMTAAVGALMGVLVLAILRAGFRVMSIIRNRSG
jgi:hypothetical protein